MGGGGIFSNSRKKYPGKFTYDVFLTCIVAASAGFIFGYDLGAGGVTSMDPIFFKKFFPKVYMKLISVEPSNDQYCCKLDSVILALYTSSIYVAAVLSSMMAFANQSRESMWVGGFVCTIGAIITIFVQNGLMLFIGRIYIGMGIGYANHSVPVYLSQISPGGAFNIVFQLSITYGILVARLLNYFTAKINGDWGWRISLGGVIVPSLIFFSSCFSLPDPPYTFLQLRGIEDAKARLRKIRGIDNVDEELEDLTKANDAAKLLEHDWVDVVRKKYRPQFILAILISLCQQLATINVYHAPLLFKSMGFDDNASVVSALITSFANFGAILIAIKSVTRYGRTRALFLSGSLQMLLGQLMMIVSIASKSVTRGNSTGDLPIWFSVVVVVAMCIYVSGYACSWGPLGSQIPAEIVPLEVRSTGQSLTVIFSMCFASLIAILLPSMLCYWKFGFFICYAVCVVGISIFICMHRD